MYLWNFERNKGHLLNWTKYTKQRILKKPRYLFTERVRAYLKEDCTLASSDELIKIQRFLKNNLVEVFNDPLVYEYNFRHVKVFRDNAKDLWYVITPGGKRLYFNKELEKKQVQVIYNRLCKEQHVRSAHNYFFDPLRLSRDSVVADIGVAEGNFALEIIDQVKEIYLFECDDSWIEALKTTFEPWSEKVHIIKSFVSDKTSVDSVSLDDFFQHRQAPDLVKMDVEGMEAQVLDGAKRLLQEKKIAELLVCTYHRLEDAKNLSEKLKNVGYSIRFSKGLMLFLPSGYTHQPPYDFRRGLLHAF